ncbi:MAG TPA: hypothetical protein VJJ52_04495 [Candidatus Nanoarchaeia archaeon]|nr:hypothetical protein [Candidatus Nanoarchaeia archaeon]
MGDLTLVTSNLPDSIELRMEALSIFGAASFIGSNETRYIMPSRSEQLVRLPQNYHLSRLLGDNMWIQVPEPQRTFRTLEEATHYTKAVSGFAYMMLKCYDLDLFEIIGLERHYTNTEEIRRATETYEQGLVQSIAELRRNYADILAIVQPIKDVGLLRYLDMAPRKIHEDLKREEIDIVGWNPLLGLNSIFIR